MGYLITAIVLITIALLAIPVLVFLLKGARSLLRILFEVAIALLVISGVVLLIVHFVS